MTDKKNIKISIIYILTFYMHKLFVDIFSIVSLYALFVITGDSFKNCPRSSKHVAE